MCIISLTVNRYTYLHPVVIQFGPNDTYHQLELQTKSNTILDPPIEFQILFNVSTNAYQLGVMLGANESATIAVTDMG